MYVRDAKNREEVWLLDSIEAMGLDETAFRSRDYVVVVDETSGEKAGFGRIRIHKPEDAPEICELTSNLGVVEQWRGQGVGAHVIERLIDKASDDDFEEVYALVSVPDFLTQFGFEPIETGELPPKLRDRLETKREEIEPDAIPMVLPVSSFAMPDRPPRTVQGRGAARRRAIGRRRRRGDGRGVRHRPRRGDLQVRHR